MSRVILLTYATHSKFALESLVKRGKSLGFFVEVIGMGTPWKGFGHRLKSYHAYIKGMLGMNASPSETKKTPDWSQNDIVILVDGYDVIPFGTPAEAIDSLRRYGVDVLISAEGNCAPYMIPGRNACDLYLPSPTKRPFLNAGGIIGKAGALCTLFEDIITCRHVADTDDDQAILTQYYLSHLHYENHRRHKSGLPPLPSANYPVTCGLGKHGLELIGDSKASSNPISTGNHKKTNVGAVKVSLDTFCEVFQCTEFQEDVLLPLPAKGEFGRYQNLKTNSYPIFLHLPGRPALLNLTRAYECRRLLLPRELLEAICKGLAVDASRKKESSKEDPIEYLEGLVTRHGEEARLHLEAGFTIIRESTSKPAI
jgi:hypothetical protein